MVLGPFFFVIKLWFFKNFDFSKKKMVNKIPNTEVHVQSFFGLGSLVEVFW